MPADVLRLAFAQADLMPIFTQRAQAVDGAAEYQLVMWLTL